MKIPQVLRLGVGQLNPTVGDFSGNTQKILNFLHEAKKRHCDLVVFPELAITGYPVWDLAINESFVQENLKCRDAIVRATRQSDLTVIVGFIDKVASGGKKSRNALALISGGRIRLTQYKTLLPTYDVFLEEIFFEPAEKRLIFPWKGLGLGTAICEDLWDDGYSQRPVQELARQGACLVVVINASPYHRCVAQIRDELVRRKARDYGTTILYVNQVGGQDDLIFDGRSLMADAKGRILYRAPAFEEGLFVYDWEPGKEPRESLPLEETAGTAAEMYEALVLGVRDYVSKNRFEKVVIGLSGGIDSALTAAIACDALGPHRILGVTMPSAYSSEGSWKDSGELARRLGIEFRTYPLRDKYESLLRLFLEERQKKKETAPAPAISLAMENLQARLRGLELMFISNDEGRLVLTTGNKSELAMGYCTLYGDMAGGLCVLGDVYKTDVYRLARFRNETEEIIPEASLTKPPSAELRPNQTDQDTLPPYEILDEVLRLYIEKNLTREEITRLLGPRRAPMKMIADILHRVDHNEYKRRQAPPILRVTEKAWFGRRMPITNRFSA